MAVPIPRALCLALALAASTPAQPLLHHYPPELKATKWVRCDVGISPQDFAWQPRLIVLVPKKSTNGEAIRSVLAVASLTYGKDGLVTFAVTDAKNDEDELLRLGLDACPVLTGASRELRAYKVDDGPMGYLLGRYGWIVWGGDPTVDANLDALEAAIKTEAAGAILVPELREVDPELGELRALVARKRFDLMPNLFTKLGRDKSLREEVEYLRQAADEVATSIAKSFGDAVKEKQPIEAVGLLWLLTDAPDGMFKEQKAMAAAAYLEWDLDKSRRDELEAAAGFWNCERLIADGKLKPALPRLRALVETARGTEVEAPLNARIAQLEAMLGKR